MYQVDVLVQGFPGRSVCHGGLGWSTITLLRGAGRIVLMDVGAFGIRRELKKQLNQRGVEPAQVTDVVLSHAHYDHAVNFTLFPNARLWISAVELEWAAAQAPGFNPLPELYVQELAGSARTQRLKGGDAFLPNLQAIAAPGHTPGHLLFYLTGGEVPLLFTGDAAKNRAELLSGRVDLSEDHGQSEASLKLIWDWWKKVPGTLLIPGHDLTMRLDVHGRPEHLGERRAAIAAWFGEDIAVMTQIDLCAACG